MNKERENKKRDEKDKSNINSDIKQSGDIDDFIFEDERYTRSEK